MPSYEVQLSDHKNMASAYDMYGDHLEMELVAHGQLGEPNSAYPGMQA